MAPILSPLTIPEPTILLITDELAAPADFVLHRALATRLKRPASRATATETSSLSVREKKREKQLKAIILSVSEGITRWKALASKSNLNLQNHIDNGGVVFLDLSQEARPRGTLNRAYDLVLQRLSPVYSDGSFDADQGPASGVSDFDSPLVILDDITTLEWIGIGVRDVQHFIRALRALCLKSKATLFVRHHLLAPSSSSAELDDLFRLLLQISAYHLEVRALSSGKSGSVTGEICLHHGHSTPIGASTGEGVNLVPRSAALQYFLTDSGPEFFAKGTAAGVL